MLALVRLGSESLIAGWRDCGRSSSSYGHDAPKCRTLAALPPDRVGTAPGAVLLLGAKSDNTQTRIIRQRVLWKHIKLEVVAAIIAAAHHAESDSGVRRKPTWLIAMSL